MEKITFDVAPVPAKSEPVQPVGFGLAMPRPKDHDPCQVRGVYCLLPDGVWRLVPTPRSVRPWRGQHYLPQMFAMDDGHMVPLTMDGQPDARFPARVLMGMVHEQVGRAHLTLRFTNKLALGSLYLYAPTPQERWVELITDPCDVSDQRRTAARILDLMTNGDRARASKHAGSITLATLPHTPVTLHSWLWK